ncbi:MAG: hypothetical protein LBU57_09065 [Dysgonamonadaceae bacterium]|jgi:hypothetical protein|nr:hypothetical protein [Dysgonamonadaceae bacterium]
MRFHSIIFCSLLIPALAFGQDSIPVLSRAGFSLSPSQKFLPYIWENPALAKNIRNFSLVDLNLNANVENNENQIPQLGKEIRQGSFNTDAQLCLKNNDYIWGKAFYRNGKKENVQWNESADFFRLYPYVALDTIGGDLKYEQYYFQGGYSKDYGGFSWGISADFKEGMEYRDKDPRPKNLTSDLSADLGATWKCTINYLLAANVHLGKYKQENNVSFYSDLGSAPVYNAVGLGLLNNRFWSNQSQTYFTGSDYGISLTFLPDKSSGWSGNLQYNQSKLNKRITNPAKIDLNRTNTNTIQADIARINKSITKNSGFIVSLQYQKRLGYESIVGDIIKGTYEILGENQPYKSEYKKLSVKGLYEKNERISWSVQPEFSAGEMKAGYVSPHRLMKIAFWRPQLQTTLQNTFGKSLIVLNLNGAYQGLFNKKLEIDTQTSGQMMENKQVLNNTYHSLTSKYTCISLDVKYYYSRTENWGIYLQLKGEQRWYGQKLPNSNALFSALGIIF